MKLAALFAILASPATAQTMCETREVVVARLASKYSETQQFYGLAPIVDGSTILLEAFANTTTGSWTVTITHADGRTCLVAVGNDYTLTLVPSGDPM